MNEYDKYDGIFGNDHEENRPEEGQEHTSPAPGSGTENVTDKAEENAAENTVENIAEDITEEKKPDTESAITPEEVVYESRETAYENRFEYEAPRGTEYHQTPRYGYEPGTSRYSFEAEQKPKKKQSPLPYIAAFLIIIGLGIGAFFVVRGLFADKTDQPDRRTTLSTKDSGKDYSHAEKISEQEEQVTEATKPVSLSKSDSTATISNADITPGSVVITDVSAVVEEVMPCLVAITDNLEVTQSYNPFNDFFGGRSSQGGSSYETVASGSGVIIGENDNELLIVTNNHVVDNSGNYTSYSVSSKGLTVQFIDDTTADAVVKGTDSEMDLAVIAVDLNSLSEETRKAIRLAVIGSSDDAKIGSGVICIGNAMGYGQSVTTGIISAKDREVTIDNITRLLLQTDAAINPGNSGGGMFNASGELIGINSAKYSDTDVEGMCFAIPISSAQDIIEDLMNKEAIPEEKQGYLGINGETVPSTYVSNYGYPEGVSVTRIQQGSPAEKAGLQLYDIITAVNGKKVSSMDALRAEISSYAAGTTVELTIQRPEGRVFRETTVSATLVSRSEISISSTENRYNG